MLDLQEKKQVGSNGNQSGLYEYSGGALRHYGPDADNPDQDISWSISARQRNCSFQTRL